jgi:hypothetical protein
MNINATRHKENSKYGHYSRINKLNYNNYNLKNTSPIKITIKKGECLFIPKGWWHWIFSVSNTKAYNIWFNDDKINIKKPSILSEKINSKINNKLLMDLLQNNKVIVYNENKNTEYESTIKDFIDSNIENTYVITLNDMYSQNRFIVDLLEKHLPIPKILNNSDINTNNINFWFNINKMDSGLHFDDDDGILCIIDGAKEILLFPPEDTLLLDGYKHVPLWLHNKIEDLLYNTNTIRNNLSLGNKINNKIHNNNLLIYSIKHPEIIRYINNLCGIFGQNNLIYGVKCDLNGNIRYEIYFYTFDKNDSKKSNEKHSLKNVYSELPNELFEPIKNINTSFINNNNLTIHSFDLYHENDENDENDKNNKIVFNKPNEKPSISLYFNLDKNNTIEQPYYGTLIDYDGSSFTDRLLFILADTKYIIDNIKKVLNILEIKVNHKIVLNIIDEYKYINTISIFNKGFNGNNPIFSILYFGITDDDFYKFLIKYNYPKLLINFYKQNYKKLDYSSKEIAIHYEIIDNKIKILRTAFYGSI